MSDSHQKEHNVIVSASRVVLILPLFVRCSCNIQSET